MNAAATTALQRIAGDPRYSDGARALATRMLERSASRCRADLPWSRGRACTNLATGADGACDECRAELVDLERWSDEEARESGDAFARWAALHGGGQ